METTTALAAYLKRTRQTPGMLAKVIGCNRSQIQRIATGERGASGPLAAAIEKATAGAVPAETLWKMRKKRRHPRRVARPAA